MSNKNRFTEIYNTNYWSSCESRSGLGSSIEYTENLRFQLNHLFKCFNIKKVFDAPCGDFNWMRLVVVQNPLIEYIGGDIVEKIVEVNEINNNMTNVKFINIDITKDKLPQSDLMICRDCLFHFTTENVWKTIKNFVESGISYLLTTTHVNINNEIINKNIIDGSFSLIDLMSAPYNFPKDFLYCIEDWIQGFPKRRMYLWSREQIQQLLNK